MAPTDPLETQYITESTNMENGATKRPEDEDFTFNSESGEMLPRDGKKLNDLKIEEEEDEEPETDQITDIIGQVGLWHIVVWVITGSSIVIHGWQSMANKFLTYEPVHWCQRPSEYQSLSYEQWANISAPVLSDGEFDRCNVFKLDYSIQGLTRPDENTETVPCTAWEFIPEPFEVSLH